MNGSHVKYFLEWFTWGAELVTVLFQCCLKVLVAGPPWRFCQGLQSRYCCWRTSLLAHWTLWWRSPLSPGLLPLDAKYRKWQFRDQRHIPAGIIRKGNNHGNSDELMWTHRHAGHRCIFVCAFGNNNYGKTQGSYQLPILILQENRLYKNEEKRKLLCYQSWVVSGWTLGRGHLYLRFGQ